ncbi:DUF1007 family protein [bacterium]|nr:DUF1007 family protein [bacterium]
MSCIMELACRCLWACLVFFVFYSPTVCQAHPHVFIDFHPLLRIKDNQLQGIDMHWTFDRFTSETIIEDIDKNNNRQFDPEERPYFDENYRSIEYEANFFLFMYMGEKIFDDFEATLKQVQILDNHIHYTIPITLNEPISTGARKSLLIEIVDPEMFVAFTL